MTTFDADRLLALLPRVYRVRDDELDRFRDAADEALRGGPLRALLEVIAAEIAAVEENIAQLHDDLFIETCAPWVVPYIGDLIGHRSLPVPAGARYATPRAEVANAITYRRRKGTAAILEQIARDVTGWPAHLAEYFQLLVTTQHTNHVRLHVRAPHLRDVRALQRMATPFDGVHRSLDVRSIARGRGRYNIANVGVTLWRLQPWDIEASMPRPDASGPDTRFRFDPRGRDSQLFNPSRIETDALGFVAETDVPDPLPRRALARELEARRVALVNDALVVPGFFGALSPIAVAVAGTRIPEDEVLVCDLSAWTNPPANRTYTRRSDGSTVTRRIGVAIDPVLGRLAFPNAVDAADVRVSYTTAFAADIGAGPYDRSASIAAWLDPVRRPVTWQIGVTRDMDTLATSQPPHSGIVETVVDAVSAWKAHVAGNPGAFGVIALLDSATYEDALTGADRIEVPAGARLAIVAAGWPRFDEAGPGGPFRPLGGLTAQGLRPHLVGDVSVSGTDAPDESLPDGATLRRLPGELIIDGVLIEGALRVLVGDLGRLNVRHCTLAALAVNGSVQPDLQNTSLAITFDHSVTGAITLPDTVTSLGLRDTISGAIDAPAADVALDAVTVLGTLDARSLDASDSILNDVAHIERRQRGCVRYSYVRPGSATPRHFRCQPDLAIERAPDAPPDAVARRVAPVFTSLDDAHAGFAQLAMRCAIEIRAGAGDGAEMGAFHSVQQPLRENNLRFRLRENLRVGLEAGIAYRT